MEENRRGFLKSAGAAAFTASLFAGDIRGANDQVNVAFIGVGRRGASNLGFAAKTPGIHVTAVCDVDRPALRDATAQAKRLGFGDVKAARDFREILSDKCVDAVCIAAPVRWRAQITVQACEAGKDVWVEAPVCTRVEEGVRMVEAARRHQRVVQAGTVHRSAGIVRQARERVKEGELGDVTFCRTFQPASRSSDWGVDLIDILQFVFDETMPLSVSAQAGAGARLATYRYPGFIASYESRANSSHGMVFHGTKATLPLDGSAYSLGETNRSHWANFVECIRSRRLPTADIETCVRSTTTSLLADLAYRTPAAWEI